MTRLLLVAAAIVAMLRPAHADGALSSLDILEKAAFVVELVFPDFRLEHSFTDDTTRYTLAVPFAMHAGTAGTIGFNHVGEIQYVLGDKVWRGSLAERVLFGQGDRETGSWMPIAELGGVFGADGYGGMLATGLVVGNAWRGSHVGVVVRCVVTDRETRGDVGFDFQIPINGL